MSTALWVVFWVLATLLGSLIVSLLIAALIHVGGSGAESPYDLDDDERRGPDEPEPG